MKNVDIISLLLFLEKDSGRKEYAIKTYGVLVISVSTILKEEKLVDINF